MLAIINPIQESAFVAHLVMLEQRAKNPNFKPDWEKENEADWRKKMRKMAKKLAQKDPKFPHLKLFAGWHMTKEESKNGILEGGFANLAKNDEGFYGKGLYFALEAQYAYRYLPKPPSKGAFFFSWVATQSLYPCIKSDIAKLKGKANHANFDSHIAFEKAPSYNQDKTNAYYAIEPPEEEYEFSEIATFPSAACLPRYLIELVDESEPASVPIIPRSSSPSIVHAISHVFTRTSSHKERSFSEKK